MEIKDKNKIWELYFDKVRDITEIEIILENKFTYDEIKSVIMEKYK